MDSKIGFIGLGTMGFPMACNLLKAGYRLYVFDINEQVVNNIEDQGAKACDSPAEVAKETSIIITMLPASKEVKEVVMGEKGILSSSETGKTLIQMSTISPSVTKEIYEVIKKKNWVMLDAPVSGGSKGAREGTLAIIVGGDSKDYDNCKNILHVMGKKIYHVGPIGHGQIIKLINQFLVGINLLGVCEAVVMAKKAGLDKESFIQVLQDSSGYSRIFERQISNILQENFTPRFPIRLITKDMSLVDEMVEGLNLNLFGVNVAKALYKMGMGLGKGDMDMTYLVRIIEQINGMENNS